MKLATFNLESFGSDKINEDILTRRIAALRPKLLELDADILCLQEVNAQKIKGAPSRQFHDLDHLVEGTPYQDYHRIGSLRPSGKGPGDRHNLVVLSRYSVLSAESLYHRHAETPLWRPNSADPAYDEPQSISFDRPVLKLEIDIGARRSLHLFNVHLRAPIAAQIRGGKTSGNSWASVSAWAEGYHLAVLKQTAQALELRLAAEALFDADNEAQIIMTGDFNATGETRALRLLRADPHDTGVPHLAGRQLFQLDASLPLDQRKTVLHKGRAQTLDHVLASQSMTDRVRHIEVFNSTLPDEVFEGNNPNYAGSYHAAMRVDFDLS
ncbi:endonuclease/exonuclease/phosphatase family protein [Roseibium sp.]|uniref:endonuclease/exonuclease/phosphatase family protein n=1 Tax=Roseibium sp. TaxID=1936156 RepID=UPI003B52F2EC